MKFEYDITPFDAASDGVDDQNAIVIPIGQLDTNYEVAVKTIAAINQPSVQNQLGLVSANSNIHLRTLLRMLSETERLFYSVTLRLPRVVNLSYHSKQMSFVETKTVIAPSRA